MARILLDFKTLSNPSCALNMYILKQGADVKRQPDFKTPTRTASVGRGGGLATSAAGLPDTNATTSSSSTSSTMMACTPLLASAEELQPPHRYFEKQNT